MAVTGGGGCHLRKLLNRHFEKYLHIGEIVVFRTFLAKFLIFAYISLKTGYFELGDD